MFDNDTVYHIYIYIIYLLDWTVVLHQPECSSIFSPKKTNLFNLGGRNVTSLFHPNISSWSMIIGGGVCCPSIQSLDLLEVVGKKNIPQMVVWMVIYHGRIWKKITLNKETHQLLNEFKRFEIRNPVRIHFVHPSCFIWIYIIYMYVYIYIYICIPSLCRPQFSLRMVEANHCGKLRCGRWKVICCSNG